MSIVEWFLALSIYAYGILRIMLGRSVYLFVQALEHVVYFSVSHFTFISSLFSLKVHSQSERGNIIKTVKLASFWFGQKLNELETLESNKCLYNAHCTNST